MKNRSLFDRVDIPRPINSEAVRGMTNGGVMIRKRIPRFTAPLPLLPNWKTARAHFVGADYGKWLARYRANLRTIQRLAIERERRKRK